jgi:hypothetical protein
VNLEIQVALKLLQGAQPELAGGDVRAVEPSSQLVKAARLVMPPEHDLAHPLGQPIKRCP